MFSDFYKTPYEKSQNNQAFILTLDAIKRQKKTLDELYGFYFLWVSESEKRGKGKNISESILKHLQNME